MFLLVCQEHWRSAAVCVHVCVCLHSDCVCICADLSHVREDFIVFLCDSVCVWEWQATVVIDCQGSAHWRACSLQLQLAHQGSVMRQGAARSHDNFVRVVSSRLEEKPQFISPRQPVLLPHAVLCSSWLIHTWLPYEEEQEQNRTRHLVSCRSNKTLLTCYEEWISKQLPISASSARRATWAFIAVYLPTWRM